jgi:transcriptional regulator with XRE-family HTH domain
MESSQITFGEFLAKKREERDITLREMARRLEVSAPFLSDVEKNRRAPLTADRLERAAEILTLSDEEKVLMYDLAGKQRNSVPPDLPEYIIERSYVSAALRTARDLDAGEEEWRGFVEDLKRKKG